jgi:hypothetical protein
VGTGISVRFRTGEGADEGVPTSNVQRMASSSRFPAGDEHNGGRVRAGVGYRFTLL